MAKGRDRLAGFCTILGGILGIVGLGVIAIGLAGIGLREGYEAVLETMSPFNLYHWIVTFVVLAPGIGLIALGQKLRDNDGN